MLHIRKHHNTPPSHPNTSECIDILKDHGFDFERRFFKDDLLSVTPWRYLAGSRFNFEDGEWIPLRGTELYVVSEQPNEFLLYSRHLSEEERRHEQELSTRELIRFRREKVARLIA